METAVIIPTRDHGNAATKRGVFLDTTTTDHEDAPGAEVVYSFSRTMRRVIANSHYWAIVLGDFGELFVQAFRA